MGAKGVWSQDEEKGQRWEPVGQWEDQFAFRFPSVLNAPRGFQCSGKVESITSEKGTCAFNGLCGRTRRCLGWEECPTRPPECFAEPEGKVGFPPNPTGTV